MLRYGVGVALWVVCLYGLARLLSGPAWDALLQGRVR